MKNDKKILESVKKIKNLCEIYECYVKGFNPCAYSDRILDDIIEESTKLEKLYEENCL